MNKYIFRFISQEFILETDADKSFIVKALIDFCNSTRTLQDIFVKSSYKIVTTTNWDILYKKLKDWIDSNYRHGKNLEGFQTFLEEYIS